MGEHQLAASYMWRVRTQTNVVLYSEVIMDNKEQITDVATSEVTRRSRKDRATAIILGFSCAHARLGHQHRAEIASFPADRGHHDFERGAGTSATPAMGFHAPLDPAAPEADEGRTLRELGRIFPPEFVNRIDRIVHFRPLGLDVRFCFGHSRARRLQPRDVLLGL